MRLHAPIFFAVAALSAAPVLAQHAPAAPPSTAPSGANSGAPPAANQGTARAPDTRTFLTTLEGGNRYEIEAARLAERQGSNRFVKHFARIMVRDHTRLGREVAAAIRRDKGAHLPSSSPIPSDLQQKLDKLKSEHGASFDREYARQMVQSHRQTLSLLRTYVRSGSDRTIRLTAGKAAPVVARHLQMAERLIRQDGASSS